MGGLEQLAKVYGSIYSLFVGTQLIVVLNGYEVVKDALSNHPEVFSDRPDIPSVTIMTKRKGKLVFGLIYRLPVKYILVLVFYKRIMLID